MVEITKETWGKNKVEVAIFNGKKWLNVTLQYSSDFGKQSQALKDCGKNQP